MTAEKRSRCDTYEALTDKLRHIYTVGCLLVDWSEQPALGAGDMILSLSQEAQTLADQAFDDSETPQAELELVEGAS